MNKLLIISGLIFIFAFAANAQTAKMASVYTNLKTDCHPESKVEADEVPFICRAVGGYRVRIVPAGAWSESIEIVDAKNETIVSLGTHGYGYSLTGKRMLEWRTANGKPFAVIFRVNKYDAIDSLENGDSPFSEKYKTGETLLVRGLKNFSRIKFEVDGKEKNANAQAQKTADANYK